MSAEDVGAPVGAFGQEQAYTDGGVFDNLGVRMFHFLARCDGEKGEKWDGVLVSDVGKPFQVQSGGSGGGLVRTAMRASDILMDRVWQLENETFSDSSGFVFARITEPVTDVVPALVDAGYEVALCLEWWAGGSSARDGRYSLREIAAGRHDDDAVRWFRSLRGLPRPVHVRPLHEGNGDWYPWGVFNGVNAVHDYVPAFRHVVVYTGETSPSAVSRMLAAGASGFFSKDLPATALVDGLERVARGDQVLLLAPHRRGRSSPEWPGRLAGLTERESEVLALLAKGYRNHEIGDALFVSLDTVKTHVKAVYRKLGVRNRAEAVRRAQDLQLLV